MELVAQTCECCGNYLYENRFCSNCDVEDGRKVEIIPLFRDTVKKVVVTVWRDGSFKVWETMDAFYAQADESFIASIGLQEIIDEAVGGKK